MKILYIGHYKEGTGWSTAAIDYILALDSIGIDVVCRNIKLTNVDVDIDQKILQLEKKSLDNIDFCIQHVLPHHLVMSQKFKKNIAYFVTESNTIKHTGWYYNLQLVDQIWVPNNTNKNILINDGFDEKRIKVVPHTFDTVKYQHVIQPLDLGQEAKDKFKFYFIGDINDRKNLLSIIKCFHSEFDRNDQVSLVLKLKKYGMDSNTLFQSITKSIHKIKTDLRMHKNPQDYIEDIILTDSMNNNQIDSLHQACNCFVGPSHGEAWSIPAFEAMCYGNTPICSNEGGPAEFIDKDNINTGCLINGQYGICDHSDAAFFDIFTGRESWFMPNELEIKKAMRYYYENQFNINKPDGLKRGRQYSYNNVANMIKDILNNE